MSYQISRKLKLINPDIFIKQNGVDNIGMGIIGELKEELSEIDFLDYLKTHMDLSNIRHSNFTGKKLKKICVLGGSGSFAIEEALINEIDCYVTADLKYHDFLNQTIKYC